jgi:hypothetical protein
MIDQEHCLVGARRDHKASQSEFFQQWGFGPIRTTFINGPSQSETCGVAESSTRPN